MRQGDFSELLTDPYILAFFGHGIQIYDPRQPAGTRTAIPGNRLDLYLGGARIDPVGINSLQFFPAPNQTGPLGSTVFQNYFSSGLRPTNTTGCPAASRIAKTIASRAIQIPASRCRSRRRELSINCSNRFSCASRTITRLVRPS
jgi:hypothetical protein